MADPWDSNEWDGNSYTPATSYDDYEYNNAGGGVGGYAQQPSPASGMSYYPDLGGGVPTGYSETGLGTNTPSPMFNTGTSSSPLSFLSNKLWGGNEPTNRAPSMAEGLFGLAKLFMGQNANNQRINSANNALSTIKGASDPNKPAYQSKLYQMMMQPGTYTQTPESHAALKQGVNAASRLAAAQGRTAQIPQIGANLTAKFGMDAREHELNRLANLAQPDQTTAMNAANLMSRIGDLKAQQSRDLLSQIGLMGTRTGMLPDYSGSQNSNQSLLQALALLQSLGK